MATNYKSKILGKLGDDYEKGRKVSLYYIPGERQEDWRMGEICIGETS